MVGDFTEPSEAMILGENIVAMAERVLAAQKWAPGTRARLRILIDGVAFTVNVSMDGDSNGQREVG